MPSIRARAALLTIATIAAVGAGVAPSSAASAAAGKPCTATVQGALWTFNGQTGVAYKIVGVNGAPCSLASSWLRRLSKQKGPVAAGPKGWTCTVKRPSGSCINKAGAVFQWAPKLRPR